MMGQSGPDGGNWKGELTANRSNGKNRLSPHTINIQHGWYGGDAATMSVGTVRSLLWTNVLHSQHDDADHAGGQQTDFGAVQAQLLEDSWGIVQYGLWCRDLVSDHHQQGPDLSGAKEENEHSH